jgi:hypothetical protein
LCDEFVRDVEDAFPVDPYERDESQSQSLYRSLS